MSRGSCGPRLGRRCILQASNIIDGCPSFADSAVYTLWHNPRILPLLYTPSFVVEKLQGGADLMTPGLQRGPPFPKKATRGAVVAIASLEAPSVPMAVGTCAIDVGSLDKVQGMKGHAVQTFHWAGDELWSWSSSSKPGTDAPDYIEGWDEEKQDDAALSSQAAAMHLADDDAGGVALDSDPTERSAAEKAQGVEGEDPPSIKDSFELVDDKELSQKGRPHSHCAASLLTRPRNRRRFPRRFPLWCTTSHGP